MIRENILIGSDRFFNIRSFQSKYFTMPRHLHAEYELVWIDRGFGKKSIGEVIKPFTDGDLTLIGPDCPHLFIADDATMPTMHFGATGGSSSSRSRSSRRP